jgi:hypothetical protein
MAFYLSWEENENLIFERENFLFRKHFQQLFTTEEACFKCLIFDKVNKKCTHPELGCDTNKARIKPWENEIICPKKIKS